MMNSFGLLNFWAFGATTLCPFRKGWGNFNLLLQTDKKANSAMDGKNNLLSRIDKKANSARNLGISALRFFAPLRSAQNNKNLVRIFAQLCFAKNNKNLLEFFAPQNFAQNDENLLEFFTPQNFSKNNANPQISSTFKSKIQRKAQISSISQTQIPHES